ncbi:unnamed protein product, partial [Meganyctiphanes norvegica]
TPKAKCRCREGESCTDCVTSAGLAIALLEAVKKIDKLTNKMEAMDGKISTQGSRLQRLEVSSEERSGTDGGTSRKSGSGRSRRSKKDTAEEGRQDKEEASSSKTKKDRVDEEKGRTYKVLQGKLRDRDTYRDQSASREESSDEDMQPKTLRKKLSRKERDEVNFKVGSRLRQAGASFPEEEMGSTENSGTDQGRSCRHKSQVRSGANVKKRPVVQTELWPHTVANEEDGEDVTHESIGLAKFFSCFTLIMMNCETAEVRGRTGLLHA